MVVAIITAEIVIGQTELIVSLIDSSIPLLICDRGMVEY